MRSPLLESGATGHHRADSRTTLEQTLTDKVSHNLMRCIGVDLQFLAQGSHRRIGIAWTKLPETMAFFDA